MIRWVPAVRGHVAVAHDGARRQVAHRQLAVDAADPLRYFHLALAEQLLGPPEDYRLVASMATIHGSRAGSRRRPRPLTFTGA